MVKESLPELLLADGAWQAMTRGSVAAAVQFTRRGGWGEGTGVEVVAVVFFCVFPWVSTRYEIEQII